LRESADADLWSYASANGFVLISKDEDFVTLYSKTRSAKLLWVRLGNCRRAFLLEVFEKQWQRILVRFENGERFVELR
jgi:predicted nuclease of predicted toxin-antitoxin system